MRQALDLSVIVPMDDDHGYAEACIDSWNAQSHPRERLQLVIVDPGNRQKLMRRVRPRLAPHDLVLRVTTDNEGLLYERGAHAGQADLLVFTEGHCLAEPEAAAEILRVLSSPEVAAVNAGSSHLESTIIARQQSLLEHQWVASWPAGHWRTISLRGFAVRRQVYDQVGGFRPEYRRFCANAFVVELERRTLRLAPTSFPIVRHGNSTNVWNLAAALRDAARGQIAWRAQLQQENSPDAADRYLGGLDFWSRRGDLAPHTSRLLAGALLRSIFADVRRPGGFQKAKHGLAVLPRLAMGILLGLRGSAFVHRVALGWAMLACSAARLHKRWLLNSYHRLWRKGFDSGFTDFVVAHPIEQQWFRPGAEPVALASLPDGAVAGLYARETWGPRGPFIRWSGPVFLLRLSLSPERSHKVTLDIRSLLPFEELCLSLFLNGSPLSQTALHMRDEQLTILLSAELCRLDGRQDLVFTCRTMRPSEHGAADRRRLGLALFTVKSDECSRVQHSNGKSAAKSDVLEELYRR